MQYILNMSLEPLPEGLYAPYPIRELPEAQRKELVRLYEKPEGLTKPMREAHVQTICAMAIAGTDTYPTAVILPSDTDTDHIVRFIVKDLKHLCIIPVRTILLSKPEWGAKSPWMLAPIDTANGLVRPIWTYVSMVTEEGECAYMYVPVSFDVTHDITTPLDVITLERAELVMRQNGIDAGLRWIPPTPMACVMIQSNRYPKQCIERIRSELPDNIYVRLVNISTCNGAEREIVE